MKTRIINKTMFFAAGMMLLMASAINSFGQDPEARPYPPKESRDKIKAHKVAFITDQLNLTPEEAQKFWPIYNEYEAKMEELMKDLKDEHPGKETMPEDLSDQEVTKILNDEIDKDFQRVNIRKEYFGKFRKVLSDRKVLKLLNSEREFRRVLIDKVRGKEMHQQKPGAPR